MRDPRLTGTSSPRLVIAAHGSADPRFGEVVEAVAARVRTLRPDLDVAIGYLEHGPPHVPDVATEGSVVVPLLLARGFHVRVDLPGQAPGARIAAALGPDPRLTDALVDRLAEAGYDPTGRAEHDPTARAEHDPTARAEHDPPARAEHDPTARAEHDPTARAEHDAGSVVLAAAGSSDERALDEVRQAAAWLADRLGVRVSAAFVSAGSPRLAEAAARGGTAGAAVASYLLAPGAFQDEVERCGAAVVSAPIGDHPAVAQVVLARYDEAV